MTFLAAALSVVGCAIVLRHFIYTMAALVIGGRSEPRGEPETFFTVLIPAHDEEAGVAVTVASARAQDYPPDRRRIVVLADNCTDRTAEVAAEAGAEVAERHDRELRGKGHALAWFISSQHWNDRDALLCLDADSAADPPALRALDAAFRGGAKAAQSYNGARDPGGSGLAALSVVTNTMKCAGTYTGRAALGLPVPMMNGWCLSGRVLRDHGWKSFSVTEDFEQTLRLGLEGVFCRFVPGAVVRSEKAKTFAGAASQRRRWSAGESDVGKKLGRRALGRALRLPSFALWELACDILLPGYAVTAVLLTISLAFSRADEFGCRDCFIGRRSCHAAPHRRVRLRPRRRRMDAFARAIARAFFLSCGNRASPSPGASGRRRPGSAPPAIDPVVAGCLFRYK
ncbi:MAG: glycosyltransferase [Deltaproteobacteria bacterium]|nr:glycosyltransferase [Deltaproteobacteria bacterium]